MVWIYQWKVTFSRDKRFNFSGRHTALSAILLPFIYIGYLLALPFAFAIWKLGHKHGPAR